jgi:two-component system, chemotaxis family, chemotaxis protein CheY
MNILVVDDDRDPCEMLSQYFEHHGCTVYSAGDALQAMDALERHPVGMVLTDFQMPHLDGIAFTRMLKADARFRDIPVLMMSGLLDPGSSERGLRQGVAMVLRKPLELGQLLSLVRFAAA